MKFFKEMASRYGEYPNVIYEIFNEPVKESWTDVVKPYSEAVVSAIRSIDPDNLIILGTPYWCQNVDEAANDPLEGENLAYSLHFYAASHKGELRDKAEAALDKGVALFVTEFGTCVATGNGFLDTAETEEWFEFMDKHHLSWCNWSIANKTRHPQPSARHPTNRILAGVKSYRIREDYQAQTPSVCRDNRCGRSKEKRKVGYG